MKVTAMTQQTDPVATAKAIVENYLERSMVPDPEGAAAYVSDDFKLVFTGGRIFAGPAESAAFNAKRYDWVKKKFLRTDAALDEATGDVHVYNTGYLYGAWKDGTKRTGIWISSLFATARLSAPTSGTTVPK